MKKPFLGSLLLAAGMAGAYAQGAPAATAKAQVVVQCPASIQVQQTPAPVSPAGWEARGSREAHPLTNVAFYSGPPDEQVQLAPSSSQRKAKVLTSRWSLPPSDRVYWVACEYAGTSAIAARPLDSGAVSCMAEHDLNSAPPVLKRWNCGAGDQR